MRRLLLPIIASVIVLAVVVAAIVLAIVRATPPYLESGAPESQSALAALPAGVARDVNAFTFDSFHAEYRLGLDDDGHATLTTVETLTARFPDYDQNRGIRRSLPSTYQGHSTSLRVVSVTDETGAPRPFEVSHESGLVDIVSAVPEGSYTYGVQTYVITYEQRDVVDYFSNTGAEEFYWNLNGNDWAQPFGRVSGTLVLEDGLDEALTGEAACYRGSWGSSEQCEIVRDGATFSVEATDLRPYQGVTIAVGFVPGTFVLFDTSYLASPWGWMQLLALALAVTVAVWALVLRLTRYRDAPGRPVIVTEYLPPRNLSLLDAAMLTGRRSRAVASQLVDFAVRRVLTVIEVEAKWFAFRSSWRLRLESALGVEGAERSLLAIFFGSGLVGGSEHTLTTTDTSIGTRVQKLVLRVQKSVVSRGWRTTVAARHSVGFTFLIVAALVATFVCGIQLSEEGRGGALPGVLIVVPIVCFLVMAGSLYRHPLTAEGAEIVDHLRGLERYIELAEADRMRVLQSPEGALREPIDVSSREERLLLTERLLPWAVLFKHEREWAKELGEFYPEGQSPSWWSSPNAFSVGAFSAGISSVSSTLSSSYSGSSSPS